MSLNDNAEATASVSRDRVSMIAYSKDFFRQESLEDVKSIDLKQENDEVKWLNIYEFGHTDDIRMIIKQNHLNDFLYNLMSDDDHRNKLIDLEDSFFLSIKTSRFVDRELIFEQMMFVVSSNFVWSTQEKVGDYFEPIRKRLREDKGVIRRKSADYLLFRIIETLIDNYWIAFESIPGETQDLSFYSKTNPNPELIARLENEKKNLFLVKKAVTSLREAINYVTNVKIEGFNENYFQELKEQAGLLNDEIDFHLAQLESSVNLAFSMQGHQLNMIMKTLTVISVIFIPLTFLAGIYGMNFQNMPELSYKYGYFVLLGLMAVLLIVSIIILKRKRWF